MYVTHIHDPNHYIVITCSKTHMDQKSGEMNLAILQLSK